MYFALVYFAILFASSSSSVNCENLPLKGRIVGGEVVNINKFPYQVSVRSSDKHICGGIIIDNEIILTAAHCTDGQNEELLSIRHGSTIADNGKEHKVIRIIQNPDFNSDYNENDSSLLKISPPIQYTRSSRPAKLAKKRSADNSEAVICGWGVHYENEDETNVGKTSLQAVTVKVVNQQTCQQLYYTPRISKTLMCAGAKDKDSCQGDSGGGLLDKKTGQIIGISSWGEGCAKLEPGVYGSVPDMLEFIEPNIFRLKQI